MCSCLELPHTSHEETEESVYTTCNDQRVVGFCLHASTQTEEASAWELAAPLLSGATKLHDLS